MLEYSVIAGDVEGCKSILDHLAADNPEGDGPALWPFIKLIRFAEHCLEDTITSLDLMLLQGISQFTYLKDWICFD